MAFDSNFVQSLDQTFDPLAERKKKFRTNFCWTRNDVIPVVLSTNYLGSKGQRGGRGGGKARRKFRNEVLLIFDYRYPLLAEKSCVCGTTKPARIPLKLQSKIALLYLVDSLAPCRVVEAGGETFKGEFGSWKYWGKRCHCFGFFLLFASFYVQFI